MTKHIIIISIIIGVGLFSIIFSLFYTSRDTAMQGEIARLATDAKATGTLMFFAVIIVLFTNSTINFVIFLIGLRLLDRFGEGGLWLNPKQTIIKALWFIPSITLVTMLVRLVPTIGWILGLIAWFIALKWLYKMAWYEMLIPAFLFVFTGFILSMIGMTQVSQS